MNANRIKHFHRGYIFLKSSSKCSLIRSIIKTQTVTNQQHTNVKSQIDSNNVKRNNINHHPSTPTSIVFNGPTLPAYLKETYTWAYLSNFGRTIFDNQFMVNAILWFNASRLIQSVLDEVKEGEKVLQPACVYGSFSQIVAKHLGEKGQLVVSDVSSFQIENLNNKLAKQNESFNIITYLADARNPIGNQYDAVICFFLLHEVPNDVKKSIVSALLKSVRKGGKVVFVDYHRPNRFHPMKPVMNIVFNWLEPFALSLWDSEIQNLVSFEDLNMSFIWSKKTFFGGMYQKIVAQHIDS